jgi:hypothetical protein
MGMTVKKLVGSFIGAAKQRPDRAPAIYRKAAQVLTGLSRDPQNAHIAPQLQSAAIEFAGASASFQRAPTIEDFTELLRNTAVAYDQVGDDPIDLIARRREIQEERSGETRTSIAPASFNEDSTLGRSAIIKFAPTPEESSQGIVETQTVAFWQGVKKEAQAVSVDVALVQPPPPANANALLSARPYGIVKFGSDGNTTPVEFDIGRGTRFTMPCNYASVLVGMDPPPVNRASAILTVGASMGTFAAPSQAPIFRTRYVDALLGGTNSDFITIPLKASQLLSIQSNMAIGETAIITLYSFSGADALTEIFYQQGAALTANLPAPLAGDEFFVKIHNGSVAARNFRLMFQLSL